MRTIIAGSRTVSMLAQVTQACLNAGFEITQVVSGTARGADQLGERWAAEHGVPVARFPADWDRFGKSAGYRRNELMAQNADALIAIWDGESRGTMHMINIARARGLKVHVHRI